MSGEWGHCPLDPRVFGIWTIARMDIIPNGHNPEWTQSQMDTVPNEHNPKWTQFDDLSYRQENILSKFNVFILAAYTIANSEQNFYTSGARVANKF